MPLWFAAACAALALIGGLSCLKSNRLKNTARGLLLVAAMMALFVVLSLLRGV